MSKPGVEPKRKLPWKTIGVSAAGVAIGAGLLALGQCASEDQTGTPSTEPTETVAPPAHEQSGWNPNTVIHRYKARRNVALNEDPSTSSTAKIFIEEGSCVESRTGANGKASRQNGFAEVIATSSNNIDASEGWAQLKNLSPNGSYKLGEKRPATSCYASFITATTATETTGAPVKTFSVVNAADFYRTSDQTSAPAGMAGDRSCVVSTGVQRGDMAQYKVNDETLWAKSSNFVPAPLHVTPETCEAKFVPASPAP